MTQFIIRLIAYLKLLALLVLLNKIAPLSHDGFLQFRG